MALMNATVFLIVSKAWCCTGASLMGPGEAGGGALRGPGGKEGKTGTPPERDRKTCMVIEYYLLYFFLMGGQFISQTQSMWSRADPSVQMLPSPPQV